MCNSNIAHVDAWRTDVWYNGHCARQELIGKMDRARGRIRSTCATHVGWINRDQLHPASSRLFTGHLPSLAFSKHFRAGVGSYSGPIWVGPAEQRAMPTLVAWVRCKTTNRTH